MADLLHQPIAVLGPGSWGTSLALLLARNGHQVHLWGNDVQQMEAIIAEGENSAFLPGYPFPENIKSCVALEDALKDAGDLLLVVPSHVFSTVLSAVAPLLPRPTRIAWATKGIDPNTRQLMHQLVAKQFGEKLPVAALSGPSFAKEVAEGVPTVVNLAGNDDEFLQAMQYRFENECFRVHLSHDLIGVQLSGVIKNVLAIAAGMIDGLQWGANARAALISCGLLEMSKLILAMGGQSETVMDVAGMGDLVLTCSDNQSRNRRLGLALGSGKTREVAEAEIGQVVEGADNARQVNQMAKECGLYLAIIDMVDRILYEGAEAKVSLETLFAEQL